MGSGWGWGRGAGGPRGAAGLGARRAGTPLSCLVRAAWGPSTEPGGWRFRTGRRPRCALQPAGRGLWAGRGPQGRGVPHAACKGRGLSLQCSRVTAPPWGSEPGVPTSRQPHGAPPDRGPAPSPGPECGVEGVGAGGWRRQSGLLLSRGPPPLVSSPGPLQTPPPWLASLPLPPPGSWLQHPPAPRRSSSQGLSPSSQGRRLPVRNGFQRRMSFAPSLTFT